MPLRVGAILDAGGGTSTVRGWWMIYWDWKDVTGLYELAWCIIIPVSRYVKPAPYLRNARLTINLVEEVQKYVKVLDEVLSEQ